MIICILTEKQVLCRILLDISISPPSKIIHLFQMILLFHLNENVNFASKLILPTTSISKHLYTDTTCRIENP